MKPFKKTASVALAALFLSALVPSKALAQVAIGAKTRPDSVFRMDGNGQRLTLPDVGYKVYEVMRATAASQLVNEDGIVQTSGVVYQVCMETGSTTTWDTLLFDTTSLLVDVNTTGRRLGPPFYAPFLATTAETVPCWTVNAQFTRGVVVLRNSTSGGAWIYWLPNGGRR